MTPKVRKDRSVIGDEDLSLGALLGLSFPESLEGQEKKRQEPPSVENPASLAGAIRLGLERKGRGGKTVTVMREVTGHGHALTALLQDLKRALGCGASLEEGALVFQGDQRERLLPLLKKKGFVDVKIS